MEKETVIKLGHIQSHNFIGSRFTGLDVRRDIEKKLLHEDSGVIIDFSGIDMITQAFADEVIGVLIREKGLQFVKEKIHIAEANKDIKAVINFVANYSVKQQK